MLTRGKHKLESVVIDMDFYRLSLLRIVDEAPDIKTFYFDVPDGFSWDEGAHVHLAFNNFRDGDKPDKSRVRHMSIATLASEGEIAITTKLNDYSPYKQDMARLEVGDTMTFFKTGSLVRLRRENRRLVFLVMGVAKATLRPLIKKASEDPSDIEAIDVLLVHRPGQEAYPGELEAIDFPRYNYMLAYGKDSYYEQLAEMEANAVFYVIGSDDFIRETIQILEHKGVPGADIVIDKREQLRQNYFATSSET